MRRRVVIAGMLSILISVTNGAAARAAERDSVVSYFRDHVSYGAGASSWISSCEWHVYDPVRHMDRLLLTLPGRASVIQWDSTGTSVCFAATMGFSVQDSIYRCAWRFGARPRLVAVTPPFAEGVTDWWFNPDSARWQASREWPIAGDTLWRELWQADAQGRKWYRLRRDSVIVDPMDGPGEWAVASAMRREPGVSAPGSREDLDRLATEAVWFDTSTVSLSSAESREYPDAEWYFLAFRAAPERGLAFRLRTDDGAVSDVIFAVDLRRHTKNLLSSAESGAWCGPDHFGAERRGYAFASFCFGSPRLVDVRTGEIVFKGGPGTRDAIWVPAPLSERTR